MFKITRREQRFSEKGVRVENKTYVVGIAGGTGSGKTTLAEALMDRLGPERAITIAHDAYYRDLGHLKMADREGINFDHPDALETELLISHLDALDSGESVERPSYDFESHTRIKGGGTLLKPRGVVILEGVLILADASLRNRMALKIFMEAEADVRLSRRLDRDLRERGRDTESVMKQYRETVKPMHDQFVEPSKAFADLIMLGAEEKRAGVDVLVAHLERVIELGSRWQE